MKTKLSRFGRSSVSVILAVMMLLSTMLIGTITTANAVDPTKFSKVYLDATKAKYKSNVSMSTTAPRYAYVYSDDGTQETYTDETSTTAGSSWPGSLLKSEGDGIYSILVSNNATKIIFNSGNGGEQTGDLVLPTDWKTTPMIYCGDGSAGREGWKTYSASKTYTVSYGVNGGNGDLSASGVSGSGSSVNSGTNVTFTANPNKGYTVEGWYSDADCKNAITGAGTKTSYEVTVHENINVYVKFKSSAPSTKDYYIRGSFNEWKVSDDYKMSYTDGVYSLTLTKMAVNDYSFKLFYKDNDNSEHWLGTNEITNLSSVDCDLSGDGDIKISRLKEVSNITFTYDGDKTLTVVAESAVNKYTVTYDLGTDSTGKGSVSATFEGTTTSIGTSPASVEDGKSVTFTATANNGYKFDGWYSNAGCTTAIEGTTGATYQKTVTDNTTVYAKFVAVSYNITTEAVTNYSVVVKESAEYNSTVSVKVTATDDAYEVNGITVTDKDGKDVNVYGGESGVYTFTMPASNVTVKANSKLKQIGAPTVTFNVLGQSTADAKVLGSTPINARYTAAANSTIVVGSEKVVVTDSDGATVSADKYSLVKDTATGNYTFTANEPGAYKLSYTVTAKSNYDASMTITNSPVSVTITVSYTDTQNAYLALEEYVNSVKNTTSDGYTTDSYAAFSAALKSAKDLLKGLPNADATNASDYTNAKTALENAFNSLEKDVTYYIGGRFKGQSWDPNRIDMQFVKVDGESNLYKYETNMTVSQLSQNVDKAKQYFFIHTGNGNEKVYYASSDGLGHTFHKNSINNQLTLKYYPTKADDEKNYIKFDDVADSSSNVVLYLDTSDKDNLKLYYSADIDPEYRLTGDLSAIGGWKGYDSALKFDTAESDGSYSKIITVKNEDVNSKYFKLIKSENGSDKYYGPDSAYDIILCNSSDKAYNTFDTSGENSDFYFSKAGTYKIHYIVKTGKSTPSVWVEENTTKHNVTVAESIQSIASVDKTEAAKGETVTVTATPIPQGQILDTVTVKGADNKQVTTTVRGNTATFTMPDQDVTVTNVTFRTANTYTVTFSSNNSEYGTVSAMKGATSITSPATVTEGDEVTFTANQNSGYTFTGWTVNGAPASSTTNPYKITVNSNTTVVANFKVEDSGTPSGWYILWGKDPKFSEYEAKELYLKDGKYYANFDAATDKIGTKENCYFVFSTSNTTNGVTAEETNVTVNKVAQNNFYFESNNNDISGVGNTRVPKIWNENADLLGFKIIVSDIDFSNKKVTYSCEPTFGVAPADTVEITAKDGTIRAGFTNTDGKKTTAVLGDTTLSIKTPDDKIITASDSYLIDGKNRAVTAKKVPNGSTVTVTTTIDPTATFAGHSGSDYYVKGFSVNGIFGGVLSQTDGKNHSGDVYTYTFEVNQENYGSKLEITPVYFLKDDANCVYFYIENYDSAKQIWGNTPSCYVYYGSGTTTLEALGYYPGQPMVDYNGSIFTQIPKYIDNGSTRVDITGMTLNNYVWDDVHRDYSKKEQAGNAQTYDYDDFVKIADSGVNADNIIYRFKYNEFNNKPADTFDDSQADDAGWEVFLDYQNYPTDIFGNRIGEEKLDYKDTNSVTSQEDYLSIISDGYQKNYIGKYATEWSIYKKTGEKVATIPSSALLYALGKTDQQMKTVISSESAPEDFLPGKDKRDEYWTKFRTLYQSCKGLYARINFEAAIQGGDDPGNRLDGRWYYTHSDQTITGEIKIQYANTLDDYKVGGFQEDTFENDSSIIGTTTGASAYFTDPENRVRKLNTTADNTQDYKFEVTATSTAAYTFVGWYRLIDGDYKAINPSNMSSLTGAVTRNSDVTLVARYIKTPGGSMTFHHSLYKGENAGGGKATTEIQVVVKDSKNVAIYDSGRIAGTASIDKTKIAELAAQTGLTVTVTLYTTTKNLYNFNCYYSAENTTDITAFDPTTGFTKDVTGNRKEGLVTKSEYTFSFNDYYNKYANILTAADAGTVYYNFYSDITSIKVPYKVQFSYTDRMGYQKYYNKAGYVDPENTSSYTIDESGNDVKVTLTKSFILSLAPYESNFTKNLTWNETPVSNTAFDSSVTDSIASAVVNSTQSDKKIHLNIYKDSEGNPTPLINNAGTFALYEKNGSSELPYGSVFYTKNDDGTYKYEITAPKTYADKDGKTLQFMYWAIYSDPGCKNLVIKAYNSDGAFSYVAYDNCWIAPVYGESSTPSASVNEVSTSTQFMEVTRNQWTAGNADSFTGFDADNMTTLDTAEDFIKGNGEDKLYADFVLNFFYNGKQLSVFDPNSENVKAGVLIQRLELDKNETGTGYITDLDHYANKYDETALTQAKNDAISKITTGTSDITSVKQQINNSRLDNKNRLQYYTRFNNVKGNNDCVFRLYTYIQYTGADSKSVVELSNPVYFTFYDIANKS